MFEYNVRTEIQNGTKFIEKDIIMFDYVYSGDMVFQVEANLKTPGFGFVIKEFAEEVGQEADNIVLIKFSNDDSYQVILKDGTKQVTAEDRFITSAVHVYSDSDVIFFFKKFDTTLSVFKGIRNADGTYNEIRLASYIMKYDMNEYKIGIYSNAGNTVKFASIKSPAPSNWISNVMNAGGGRIKWIKHGFTIEEAEYDIEVEAETIQLKAGTYWFDYECDNPDMKAYIFNAPVDPSTDEYRRTTKTIEKTKVDENKNLLQEDGKLVLDINSTVNIKFKGKWGTVTNICVKDNKNSGYIETSYGVTTREKSKITVDLTKVVSFHVEANILSVPFYEPNQIRPYDLFRRGEQAIDNILIPYNEYHSYDFSISDNILLVDGEFRYEFNDPSETMILFDNITAIIRDFTITLNDGRTGNVLLRKTMKAVVSRDIKSPIMAVNHNNEPYDLSSAYRKIAVVEKKIDLFNALNGITLTCYPDITNSELKVYGIPLSVQTVDGFKYPVIDKTANKIDDLAMIYTEIPYELDRSMLIKKTIKIPYEIRKQYKYIAVEYNAIKEFKYYFTNYEREIYKLDEVNRIYLNSTPLSTKDGIVVFGIKDESLFNEDLLYYVKNKNMCDTIHMCTYDANYDIIDPTEYSVNDVNRVIIGSDILSQYKYIIIDYLKDNSYTVNETEDYYEVEISTNEVKSTIVYDSKDGKITEPYRQLTFEQMTRETRDYSLDNERPIEYAIESDDFVVLQYYEDNQDE